MNNLSLLMYFAEVIASLGILVFLVGLACVAGLTFALIGSTDVCFETKTKYYLTAKRFGVGAVAALALSTLFPSKETIYLIAASEIGEEAIKTPEFMKMRKILNDRLDEALENDDEA